MNNSKFSKKHLALCISAVFASGVSTNLYAQETESAQPAKEVEVIEVTGIRSSLIKSSDLKRDKSGVVDVISAEDMGKFPDSNLAESLQRITGVTVSRNNGEGSQITVRGFGPAFNLITLNGRQMPGTGNTRSYNLENLSTEGVNQLEVYKTARADIPTGGLGATVNIVTVKPMQSPGEKYSFSAKGIHDTSNETGDDVTPELAGIYSNTYLDDSLGFAVSFNHQQRDFQQQSASIQGWQANVALPDLAEENVTDNRTNPEGAYFFPRDMNYGINNIERERTNASVTFQYAPMEDFIISLDYVKTEATTGLDGLGWGQWHDYGGNINGYILDENGTAVWADMAGNDGSYTANRSTTEVNEDSFGVNFDWQVTESLHLSLDYHDSTSDIDNGKDPGLDSAGSLVLGSDQLITKIYDYRNGEIPHSEIHWKNGSTTLAPSEIDSHFSQFLHNVGESNVEQVQLDGTWENFEYDSIPLVNITFGISRTEQTIGGSNAWSGLIGGFLFNPSYTEMFPDGMFTRRGTSDFLDGLDGGGSSLNPNYYYEFSFDEVVARSLAFLNEDLLGADYFDTTAYRDGSGSYGASEVREDTNAIYLSTEWVFDIADFPVEINAGFRYEETEVEGDNFQDVPVAVWWKGGSEWHTQYDGESFDQSYGDYDVFLPMIDVKVDITDELVGRVSWGKTISRGPLGVLAGGRNLSGSPKIGSRNGSAGNTNLEPYESTNLDISFEYYYEPGSYAAVGYFKKDVKNFVGTKISQMTFDGIQDIYNGPRWKQAETELINAGEQATYDAIFEQMQRNGATLNEQGYITPEAGDPLMVWDISAPFNAPDEKTVDGFEVAVQHMFGETGFGVGVNGTFVDGDVEFEVDNLEQQTPLEGIGDSANFQGFYEKHGLSVKVTYAWRDDFLIGVGQSQGSSDNPPQFAKDYGQWDMSINYDVSERFTVFFEGLNLTDEAEQGYGRYEEQFLFARQYGPRYTLGARYTFK
jgi:TonB-dependent receptor